MFPGAGAHVYYNEEGEPLGWDYPDYDPEPPEPDDDDDWYDYLSTREEDDDEW
jgi:hypothetical protein